MRFILLKKYLLSFYSIITGNVLKKVWPTDQIFSASIVLRKNVLLASHASNSSSNQPSCCCSTVPDNASPCPLYLGESAHLVLRYNLPSFLGSSQDGCEGNELWHSYCNRVSESSQSFCQQYFYSLHSLHFQGIVDRPPWTISRLASLILSCNLQIYHQWITVLFVAL